MGFTNGVFQLGYWAVSGLGAYGILESNNGEVFAAKISAHPNNRSAAYDVALNDNRQIAFGNETYADVYLKHGPDLQHMTSPSGLNVNFGSAAANGTTVVATGSHYDHGFYPDLTVSTNSGQTFKSAIFPNGVPEINLVRYANGQFLGVGRGIARSTDGIAWQTSKSIDTNIFNDAIYARGLWVVVGNYGAILTSPDGIQFTARASGTFQKLNGIAASNDKFVAVGDEGTVVASANGVDWIPSNLGQTSAQTGIAYGNGLFVSRGGPGVNLSTDGVQWIGAPTPNVSSLRIAFNRGVFLLGGGSSLFASANGTSWTETVLPSGNIYGVDASDGKFWVTGAGTALWVAEAPNPLPSLAGERLDSSRIKLTITAPESGTYRILSTATLPAVSWDTITTLTNISGQSTWTHTNLITGSRFYQLQKAD